jgi:hypothetical protein
VNVFDEWVVRWNVSPAAVHDLSLRLGVAMVPSMTGIGSESRVQALIRLDAGRQGVTLFRNNVGALLDARGVPVRYGLANESSSQNRLVKSADLIGIGPRGQFVSVEAKWECWKWSGDAHELAQRAWMEFVISKGGFATFSTGQVDFSMLS